MNELLNDLPFLPRRMKTETVEKLVVNYASKKERVIHLRNLKQGLNHRLFLKKAVIESLSSIKKLA